MVFIQQETSFTNALEVLNAIPEFSGKFTHEYLAERLNKNSFILLAFKQQKPVGCKIAYNRYTDGSLYAWLGGVLPAYRKQSIAKQLNAEMEKIALKENYNSIVFKTRNKFPEMLRFGLKHGYQIVGFEEKSPISENRILLKKELF